MSASELLGELRATPVDQPLDWAAFSKRIADEFAKASSPNERGEVLAIRAAAIKHVVQQLQLSGDHLEKFIDACELEYKRLIVQETMVGARTSFDLMLAVTDREIAAGRMSEDYALREIAKEEYAATHPHEVRIPDVPDSGDDHGRLGRLKSWLGILK